MSNHRSGRASPNDARSGGGLNRNMELLERMSLEETRQRALRDAQELQPMGRSQQAALRSLASSSQSQLRQQAQPNNATAFARASRSPVDNQGSPDRGTAGLSGRGTNPYYTAAAARASENLIRGYSSASEHRTAPEIAPPATNSPLSAIHHQTGWSIVATTRGSGSPPCERSLHAGAVLNGVFLVFGGYSGQTRVNDFHAYSFAEKRWSPVLPSANSGRPPSPRDRHTGVVYGNSFYVYGGFDGTSRVSDFFGFDFSSMTWREIIPLSGRPPSDRHSHSAVVFHQKMLVFGGYDGSYKSDLHEFDFSQSKWTPLQTAGRRPRARYRATCVTHKASMLLFGGHDGTRHLNDTHILDLETHTWADLVTDGTPPIPRDSHVAVLHSNSMYVYGGSSGSAMNDLHELQISATGPSKWRQIKPPNNEQQPTHRFCHVGACYENSLYIFGGYDGSERLNDFIRFDFAAYDLSFEVPQSTIISDFRALVNDETLSDVTFLVEDQPVYAHKLMLMRCSYFQALFLGSMREAELSTIKIDTVSRPIFLQVLEYLYTDHVHISLDSAMELFEAADLFIIPRLKTMCERRMLQSITIDTAAHIFYAADMHSATTLRGKALKYILSHFEEVSRTTAFEEMGRLNMELVFEILRSR